MIERMLDCGRKRSLLALASAIAMCAAVMPASAQLDSARQTQNETVQEGVQAQNRVDTLDAERGEIFRNYKSALRQLEDFRRYNAQLRKEIADQEAEKERIRNEILRVGDIDKDVVPLMLDMLTGLEQFISEDAPFLAEERNGRVTTLKELMDRADVQVAEKFRRILEAYQIENDYGRAIETYTAEIEVDGEKLNADFLKIGRVALFYQTGDRNTTKFWDRDAAAWVDLPGRFAEPVRNGIKMAKEVIPPNLIVLPVKVSNTSSEGGDQ